MPRPFLAATLVAFGCSVSEPTAERDVCLEVSEHVAACTGTPSPAPADCDAEAAAELLDQSCQEIDAGKADIFADALCAVGLLRHCPVPECSDALPASHDFTDDDCAALIELEGCAACDYYRCREAQSVGQCGNDGYYQGFGARYCVRYAQTTEPKMTPEGQLWSASSRRCLIESLDANVVDSPVCEALVEAGYATHAACYRETRFCDLPLSDVRRVVSTIDVEDVDLREALEVGLDCLHDL